MEISRNFIGKTSQVKTFYQGAGGMNPEEREEPGAKLGEFVEGAWLQKFELNAGVITALLDVGVSPLSIGLSATPKDAGASPSSENSASFPPTEAPTNGNSPTVTLAGEEASSAAELMQKDSWSSLAARTRSFAQQKATMQDCTFAPWLKPIWENRPFQILTKRVEEAIPELYAILSELPSPFSLSMRQKKGIIFPPDELLKEVAQKYKTKYEIDISIISCNGNELGLALLDKLKDTTPRLEGVIYSPQEKGHVNPIVLQILDEKKVNLFTIDVQGGGWRQEAYSKELEEAWEKLVERGYSVTFATPDDKDSGRQADSTSCRTGALVTLRNALLDLKMNLKENDSICDHIDNLNEYDACNYDMPDCLYDIPDQWIFTDQIYRPKDDGSQFNPRQLYSKQEEKTKNPLSIKESRAIHQKPLEYECILHFPISKPENFDQWQKLEGITCDYNERAIRIEWTAPIMRNTYMLEKGYSIAGLKYQ